MKVWIMRGIPGAGKDTFIDKELKSFDPIIICCDDKHMVNGTYQFDKNKAEEYHNQCLFDFVDALRQRQNIVVNNTNIRMFELAPYYRLAQAFGYEVQIVQFMCDPELGIARNVHNVPPETVRFMAKSIEPVPPWWNVMYVPSADTLGRKVQ